MCMHNTHRTLPGGAKMTPVTGSFCAVEMEAVAWPKDTGGGGGLQERSACTQVSSPVHSYEGLAGNMSAGRQQQQLTGAVRAEERAARAAKVEAARERAAGGMAGACRGRQRKAQVDGGALRLGPPAGCLLQAQRF